MLYFYLSVSGQCIDPIGGVMVSMLVSSLVYGGFIGGVMVRGARLECCRSWVHR